MKMKNNISKQLNY